MSKTNEDPSRTGLLLFLIALVMLYFAVTASVRRTEEPSVSAPYYGPSASPEDRRQL